ncbi:MAG: SAM-dependent methyltransferase [Thermoproteota archaeon]
MKFLNLAFDKAMVSLAPFVASPPEVVRAMLELAQVSKDDVICDMGCGDGRILFMAVSEFGVKKAIGYEIRRDLYNIVLDKVLGEDLSDRVVVYNRDCITADLSDVTVITLYLTTSGNDKLRPKFEREAKPGTRIVSHDFSITGWKAAKIERFGGHTIYLYIVPEAFQSRLYEETREKRSTRSFWPFGRDW